MNISNIVTNSTSGDEVTFDHPGDILSPADTKAVLRIQFAHALPPLNTGTLKGINAGNEARRSSFKFGGLSAISMGLKGSVHVSVGGETPYTHSTNELNVHTDTKIGSLSEKSVSNDDERFDSPVDRKLAPRNQFAHSLTVLDARRLAGSKLGRESVEPSPKFRDTSDILGRPQDNVHAFVGGGSPDTDSPIEMGADSSKNDSAQEKFYEGQNRFQKMGGRTKNVRHNSFG